MSVILETERLILRGWGEQDADSLFKYASDDRVGPPAGWLPHSDVGYSRAVIRTILSRDETYAICLKGGENEPIGSIGLTIGGKDDRELADDEAEIGFWLGVPFWGRGIAPEAVKELLRHCFVDLGLNTIFCAYFEGNEKSKRVQLKCGFVPHHVDRRSWVAMFNETRVEYFNVVTRADWEKKYYKSRNNML